MLNERMEQIQNRIKQVMKAAEERYGVDFSEVQVRFDLRGRCAGIAGYQGTMFGERNYFLRFNCDMIKTDAFKHLIDDTVPHEIAHIVCYMRPELGRKHDAGWKKVCRALGGGGERCHNEQVAFANGKSYQYKTTAGRLVILSEKRHRNIQMGATYTVRRGGGQITKACEWVLFKPGVAQLAEGHTVAPRAVALKTGSKAEKVREFIRLAKRNDMTQSSVIWTAQVELGMSKGQAQRYVTENWDRA